MCCWKSLAHVISCWQARYCLLFKAAASGSSCDHTGSASTTCLPQNGDHYYRRFSLTFSKIETESWVLFTKNNQEDIGNRCASGLERPDFLSTTVQNRRSDKHFRLFLIESDVAELYLSNGICNDRARVPGMFLAPLTLTPVPSQSPPSGHMKEFLNLARSISVRTQSSFSPSVWAQPSASSIRCRQAHEGWEQEGVLQLCTQEPKQMDLPKHRRPSHNPLLYVKELWGVGAVVSWRETEVVVRFNKPIFLFSWTMNMLISLCILHTEWSKSSF